MTSLTKNFVVIVVRHSVDQKLTFSYSPQFFFHSFPQLIIRYGPCFLVINLQASN